MVSQMSDSDRSEVWEEVEAELSRFELGDRFEVEHRVIVAAGIAE
jgi:hypothetical protein